MNTSKKKVQRKKISLKPYVYPRCSEINATFQEEMIQRIQFLNSRLKTSFKQTMIPSRHETVQDFDELEMDTNKQMKNSKIKEENQYSVNDDDCKTSISLFSRINKLKSTINQKHKRNSYSERNEQTTSQSHNSHNSQRLKKLYQTEIKSNIIKSIDLNTSHETQSNNLQRKMKQSLKLQDLSNIHNCSDPLNNVDNQKKSEDEYQELFQSARTNSFQRANQNKKRRSSKEIEIQPNRKFNVGLYAKLQQIKRQKQNQGYSFMVFSNHQYF